MATRQCGSQVDVQSILFWGELDFRFVQNITVIQVNACISIVHSVNSVNSVRSLSLHYNMMAMFECYILSMLIGALV